MAAANFKVDNPPAADAQCQQAMQQAIMLVILKLHHQITTRRELARLGARGRCFGSCTSTIRGAVRMEVIFRKQAFLG